MRRCVAVVVDGTKSFFMPPTRVFVGFSCEMAHHEWLNCPGSSNTQLPPPARPPTEFPQGLTFHVQAGNTLLFCRGSALCLPEGCHARPSCRRKTRPAGEDLILRSPIGSRPELMPLITHGQLLPYQAPQHITVRYSFQAAHNRLHRKLRNRSHPHTRPAACCCSRGSS